MSAHPDWFNSKKEKLFLWLRHELILIIYFYVFILLNWFSLSLLYFFAILLYFAKQIFEFIWIFGYFSLCFLQLRNLWFFHKLPNIFLEIIYFNYNSIEFTTIEIILNSI
jgi:hypothetical protein